MCRHKSIEQLQRYLSISALGLMLFAGSIAPVSAAGVYSELEKGLRALEAGRLPEALKRLDQAFRSGHADAGFHLGRIVERGLGVQKDPEAALQLYREAAKRGSPMALNYLANLLIDGKSVRKDVVKARKFYCLSGKLGSDDGTFHCGLLHLNGIGGVKDVTQGVHLLERAAENHHLGAHVTLAMVHRNGAGKLRPDAQKFQFHIEQAAARGNPIALFTLGQMFEDGTHLARSSERALFYYTLSAMRGHKGARDASGRLSRSLSPSVRNRVLAEARYWRALRR